MTRDYPKCCCSYPYWDSLVALIKHAKSNIISTLSIFLPYSSQVDGSTEPRNIWSLHYCSQYLWIIIFCVNCPVILNNLLQLFDSMCGGHLCTQPSIQHWENDDGWTCIILDVQGDIREATEILCWHFMLQTLPAYFTLSHYFGNNQYMHNMHWELRQS